VETQDHQTLKPVFEVKIAGLPLKLRSSHDEQTVRQLVELVDQKYNQAMAGGGQVSHQNAVLLAALHIAEEFVLLKRSMNSQLGQLESQATELLRELESSPLARIRLDN
jgi:cell division protein ZapA